MRKGTCPYIIICCTLSIDQTVKTDCQETYLMNPGVYLVCVDHKKTLTKTEEYNDFSGVRQLHKYNKFNLII